MKARLLIAASFIMLTAACYGQQKAGSDIWNRIMGEWIGEGSGQPGQGGGTFSFAFDLDRNIIVRKSHSEYPATAGRPEVIHDDLMIIYMDNTQEPVKAIYFDNEGHVINYSISYADNSVVFISGKTDNAPIFRLTYTLLDNDMINTKFEMSPDGTTFMTYIEGKSKRIK